ncbi:MAG: Gfo/Idh/MocA family oxidoreductase [Anaerolineales bacterium]|jgi:predicted dehydrogenase
MRFLISGLGSIGRRHLKNLVTLGQTDIVFHRTGKSTLPDDELAGYPAESDLSEALERWSPDAVIVSNPTALHLEVAVPAARAGCSLLLEKPISHTLDHVDELRAALDAGGGNVLVGFQFRFHPGLQHAARLLRERVIGDPISVRAHWGEYLPTWHPWEDYRESYSARRDMGGGVLLTLCHPFDYLRWLCGEVSSLFASVGNFGELELDVEDTAAVLLSLEGDVLGTVYLDYNQQPASHWLEISGTRGSIRWDNADGAVRWWTTQKREWEIYSPAEGFERNTLFLEEMRHFIDVVRGDAQPRCTLQDGIRALKIVLAAKRSAARSARVDLEIG